ncbi:MAG: hypothetical protein AB9869_02840 [Verrucomicrobiia bacterium]
MKVRIRRILRESGFASQPENAALHPSESAPRLSAGGGDTQGNRPWASFPMAYVFEGTLTTVGETEKAE